MIYLASPYSNNIPDNYQKTSDFMWKQFLSSSQEVWYSPILHWHHVSTVNEGPSDWVPYRNHNHHMLRLSSQLLILTLDGWETSAGVAMELQWAKEMEIPYLYIDETGQTSFVGTF